MVQYSTVQFSTVPRMDRARSLFLTGLPRCLDTNRGPKTCVQHPRGGGMFELAVKNRHPLGEVLKRMLAACRLARVSGAVILCDW